MDKPPYELTHLRAAVNQCLANILIFQKAITKEENKLDELRGYIKRWEEYNRWIDGHTGEPPSES